MTITLTKLVLTEIQPKKGGAAIRTRAQWEEGAGRDVHALHSPGSILGIELLGG